jgi:hypothetical protein
MSDTIPLAISLAVLRDCQDYAVESPDGHIGTVTEIIYAADDETPTALAIRAGRAGSRVLIVPVSELVEIQVTRHRITLRASPDVTTTLAIVVPPYRPRC